MYIRVIHDLGPKGAGNVMRKEKNLYLARMYGECVTRAIFAGRAHDDGHIHSHIHTRMAIISCTAPSDMSSILPK